MSGSATEAIGPLTQPLATTGAFILANWTSIAPEEAQSLYDGLAGLSAELSSSKRALLLRADLGWIADERVQQIMALCRAAMEAGLLREYCIAIVSWERAKGRAGEQLSNILNRILSPGTPQAVLNPDAGFTSTDVFDILSEFSRAIGYVEVKNGNARQIIGTAFLVRPDVIITSAHVAFEARLEGGRIVTGPPTRNIDRICFPRARGAAQEAKLADTNPVLAYSEALMLGVNQLDRQVDEAALGRLDYALLRLDRVIDRATPIDHQGKDVAVDGRRSFLIGFLQNANSLFDTNSIVRSEAVGGRIIHTINSAGGMSGSCLIDNRGVPVALHEGSIPKLRVDGTDEVQSLENRAVLLKAIARDLESRPVHPLAAPVRSAGLVMYDEALVTRLGRRGGQLLADPASQAGWVKLMTKITRAGADGLPWTAHPWFTDPDRARIEKWFAAAATTAEISNRVAFISGPRGSGKTFMIDVLKRIVPNAGTDLIRIAWSEGDTTLATLARQLAAAPGPSGTRTAEGHARYENVPGIVAALETYGMPAPASTQRSRPLFIAIDAGDETGSVTEPKTWIELVQALSRQSWARVVLCGLPKELLWSVKDALPPEVTFEHVQIEHVRSSAIVKFLERFGMAAEAVQTPRGAAVAFDASEMPHKAREELTTCMAALFAIAWHRGILPLRDEGVV
ncbi:MULTISPECIES: trypsin-like serine peptidase [Rhizobium]|uniref:trypsin-like serine peptidase n=1 Tax=Rhizobium TaxID=379 RepID=UPI001C916901|nr:MULTISPECIES: serine protease [Rhizobium]MBY3271381.1 trypsin-like peptidase domain-containing protein [Rhizobium laguerreae]MBY3294470.1 trypsin-like peptidase domain-containing protein [Rhizobium laguerreae]MBY3495646.1 trypsin-like peptidase domain-containing protein [Rhizobium laguerreae]MBY3543528.1 trypsin-like peptidase domain-containing protein [Rhizobium laguerreae]MBY5740996.1 trypsin-like peptidase domain-containing protein [Rhizobium leguminosarum]